MRTDVKLGIVFGLAVLAVMGWYMLGRENPEPIAIAQGEGMEKADSASVPLPPPLFSSSRDRAEDESARGPKKRTAAPKRQRPKRVTTAKAANDPARRAKRAPTTKPKRVAQAEANRRVSLDKIEKKLAAKRPKAEEPPIVAPPGAKPPKVSPRPKKEEKPQEAKAEAPKREIVIPPIRDRAAAEKKREKKKGAEPKERAEAEKKPPKPKIRFHDVKQGETFATIAAKHYGSQKYAKLLLKANPRIPDARRLRVGVKLIIPPLDVLTGATSKPSKKEIAAARKRTEERAKKEAPPEKESEKKPATPKFYVVQKDDSLYAIAREVWGDGTRWKELLQLNKDVCPSPSKLRPGMKLRLTK